MVDNAVIIDAEGEFHTLREKYTFLLVGKCPSSILKYICTNQHSWNTKTAIAENTNYSVGSGGFNNGISKLVSGV